MSNEREIVERIATLESSMENVKEWNHHQNERMNKIEDQIEVKTEKLENKIDKIIENEKKLLENINDSGSVLDDKIDERFNKLQMWLLGTAATAGLSLLIFIFENLINK
ncbi:gp215 [Bacillus phage G]|uniref:Gp215 n=1 Tax=Bacillus phage G TaxID=2884420 RepID=G3MBT1_9CAUD|nr:gp215 [Bacillus phage G]AEO93474.1 gp215 [Bacillus phage G]